MFLLHCSSLSGIHPSTLKDTQTKTKHKTHEVKWILLWAQTVMSKSLKRSQPGHRNFRTSGRGLESSRGQKTNRQQPGGEAKPTRRRLQSGRSIWQMPFKRVIRDGFMWSVCTKAVNYLGPVTVVGFQKANFGLGTTLQHDAELKRSDNLNEDMAATRFIC